MYVFFFQGSEGFENQINKCLENAEYLYDQLQKRTDFKLVFDSKVSNFQRKMYFFLYHPCHVCFSMCK